MLSKGRYFSISLKDIIPDTRLPFNLYFFINHHFVLFRNRGAKLDQESYTRLQLKTVRILFLEAKDAENYDRYLQEMSDIGHDVREALNSPIGKLTKKVEKDLEKAFELEPIEEHIEDVTDLASKSAGKLVEALHEKPYSTKLLAELTIHSYGLYGHCVNVSTLAVHIAMQLGFNQRRTLENIGSAGLLHDIGKIKIHQDIIRKNRGAISPRESIVLRKHPVIGRDLLLASSSAPGEIRKIVYQHHENFDGSGYPAGLKGNQIFELTKIISIVNTFEHLFHEMKAQRNFSLKALLDLMTSKQISNRFDGRILDRIISVVGDF